MSPLVSPCPVSFICLGSSQISESSARLSPSTVPNWELNPALTAFVQYRDYIIRCEATAHGAIVCLTVPGSIDGTDLLRANIRDLYPGEPLAILARDLGFTSSTRLLFQPRISRLLTADPSEIFKTISSQETKNFEKGTEFRQIMFPLLGTGLFNADGDMWKCVFLAKNLTSFHLMIRFHRKMTRPFHCERLKARLRLGHPVDIADIILRFTLDDATSFLFNHDLHCLDAGLRYPHYVCDTASRAVGAHPSNAFAEASHAVQTLCATRNRYGRHWPLTEFWANKLDGPMGVVRAFLDPILREAVAKKQAADRERLAMGVDGGEERKNAMGDREVQEGETLLDHLVNLTQDHSILRDEIMNITAAGRDTVRTLSNRRFDHFVSYMLAERPKVMEKLRSEILRVVGPTRRPTFNDFRELKYLRVQTLPLYPSVPFNQRTALHPTVLRMNNGLPIYVPIGGKILVSQFVMHRRTDLWGPDALEFDPERFLDERLHKYLRIPRSLLLRRALSSIALAPDAQPPASRPPPSWLTFD
ncbi:cytochrome P450 [Mycena leptocephala]|nr:cytochrome P450 [Mycena leptocephala]